MFEAFAMSLTLMSREIAYIPRSENVMDRWEIGGRKKTKNGGTLEDLGLRMYARK